MSNKLQELHNKGAKDAAEEKGINLPNGKSPFSTDRFFDSREVDEKKTEENNAYYKGYFNALKQKK